MNRKITSIFFLFSFGLQASVQADSPLTSTPFHRAYFDVPTVSNASIERELSSAKLAFLHREKVPLDQKLAVVNALGWKFKEDQGFTAIYANSLTDRYDLPEGSIFKHIGRLNAEEITILCYFAALGDYLDDERLQELESAMEVAILKDKKSYGARLVHLLIRFQLQADRSVWREYQSLDVTFDLEEKLRPTAETIIRAYLSHYV